MEPGTSETIVARENPIGSSKPLPCYFDHDGGYDDFVALVYILRHQARFNILGVTVTPANSWREVGVQVTRKILRILHRYNEVSSVSSSNKSGRQQVPVAESTLYGKNPFPDAWRLSCCAINLLPQLNRFETTEEALRLQEGPGVSGEALLAKTLLSAEAPVTLIATGPLTNVAWVLDNFPEASSKIDKVLIMGGAIDVPGNVSVKGFDGSAEWNFFWDPAAAKRVWESDLELVLTPLDATDSVPITKDMILREKQRRYPGLNYEVYVVVDLNLRAMALGSLVPNGLGAQGGDSAFAALVGTIWAVSGGHLLEKNIPFFAWDLVTVVQLVHPELFTISELECDIVSEGTSQGRVVRCAGTTSGSGREELGRGRKVSIVRPRDTEQLCRTILNDLCSSA